MLLSFVGVFVFVASTARAQYLLGLAEGEICRETEEGPWTCASHKTCTHIDVKVSRPSICSFEGRDPIICCPPRKLSKAEMSCMKHTELCNQFNMFRVVGDRNITPDKTMEWTANDDDEAVVLEAPSYASSPSNISSDDIVQSSTTASLSVKSNETDYADSLTTTVDPKKFASADGGVVSTSQAATTKIRSPTVTTPGPATIKGKQFVVGGQLSLPRTHRHMALIGYGPKNDISWRCGGSLVSEFWVLSAAHCTTTVDLGHAKWARLGELDHASNTDDAKPQDKRIAQRINHPQYKDPLKYHDIALYKLESRVVFDQYVAPICLQTTFDVGQTKAMVVGWGRTGFADDLSSRLMEVDIALINHTECVKLYGKLDSTTPQGLDRKGMLCAGERQGGKDACTGDSGGPLVVNQPGTCLKKQVGVTSFGKGCGLPNAPGIYTRVSTYVPWIESIVWA